MKNEYYYFAVSLFSIIIMGCSNDSGIDVVKSTQLVPVVIRQASVSGSATVTRASSVIKSGKLGVFRTSANNYPIQNNVPYSYKDAGWSAENSDDAILVDHRNATLVAYYPYQSTITDTKIPLIAQSYSDEKDFCYGTSSSEINNATPGAASFQNMKHAYSRIKLSIQRHATNYVSGSCAITNVNLKSSTVFYKDNTIDIASGTLQSSSATSGWDYNPSIASIAAGATNTTYDVLVPPQPITTNLTIALTIDGKVRSVSIPATKFTNSTLAAGAQYTIELLITDSEIIPSGSVTVSDWPAQTNGGSGSLEL